MNLIEAYEAMIEAEEAVKRTDRREGLDYEMACEEYLKAKQIAVEAGWDQESDPREQTQAE